MHVTAIFETWYIGDGIYPEFAVGDTVRIVFEGNPSLCRPLPAHTSST
jgi:hypothetical protein